MVDSKKAIRSGLWSALESGGLAALSFGALIAYTRLVPTSDLGAFAVIMALAEILNLIVTMLFHDAIVQAEGLTRSRYNTAFTLSIGLGVAVGLGCLVGAKVLTTLIGHPQSAEALMWLGVMFPMAGAAAPIMARQRREFDFRALAVRSLFGRIAGALIGIGMAFAGFGIWSLIAQQLVMTGGSLAVLWILAKEKPSLGFNARDAKVLFGFGVLSIAALLANFSLKRIFIIIIGIWLGATTAAYVNVAFRTTDTLWSLLATAIQQVALPTLSRLQNESDRLKRAYVKAVGLSCTVLYPCFIGLACVAPEVVHILFGGKWASASGYLSALSLLALIQVPRMFVTPVLTALGRPHDNIPITAAAAIFLLLAIPTLGIPTPWWAIGLWAGCEIVMTPVASALLYKRTRISPFDQIKGAFGPLAAIAVMAGTLKVIRLIIPASMSELSTLPILTAVGAATYVLALAVFDRKAFHETLNLFRNSLAKR